MLNLNIFLNSSKLIKIKYKKNIKEHYVNKFELIGHLHKKYYSII